MPLSMLGYAMILDKPLIVWIGILLLLLISLQVLIAFLNLRMGIDRLPMGVHGKLGYVLYAVALLHATLGLALYFP